MELKYIKNKNDNYISVNDILKMEFNISTRLLTKLINQKNVKLNNKICDTREHVKIDDIVTVNMEFEEENSNIVEESSVVTEFIPKDENNYTITCKIVEQNETIFEVSVYAASREKAKQISDNWKSNATKLYPQILELLSNNKDGINNE